MATSPLGGFANLSQYQNQVAAQKAANPGVLNSILQGIQQGIALEQSPQMLQEQLLARQLQNALIQQRLSDLQNPEQALARKIQQELTIKGALNPDLGIQQAPVGLEGITIQTPGALTLEQQAALPTADIIPTAQAGSPETPVSAFGIQTGLNINPNIREQAASDKLNRDIALANARVRSSGVQGQFIPDGFGGMIFAQKPTVPGGDIVTTRVMTPENESVKVAPKGIKNILAENDKTGRITNIALAPGEEIPEGFTQVSKKSAESYKNIDSFRKEISSNPVVKQFASISQYKQRIDDAIKEAASTNNFVGVDQTLISAFNRLNEPDSVTMVSEYARTSADAPIINKIKANIARITEGGRLSPDERAALSRLSDRIYQTSLGNYSKTVDYFEDIGERRGWNPADFIQPLGIESSAPATAPAPSSTPKVIRITPRNP